MASQWIKARQTKYAAYAVVYILMVIAAVVVANVLADRYHKSYDSTANKRFSLSEQTAKIIKGLKQDATITYFDKTSGFEQARGILDRYRNLSSRIHIQYIDYQKQPTIAKAYGLRYGGTAFVEIGPRREEAKSLTEEGITGAFLKDLKGVRRVCIVSGSQEHALDESGSNGLSHFRVCVLGHIEYFPDRIPHLHIDFPFKRIKFAGIGFSPQCSQGIV